jgi:autotransporter strand-loop-strand O-heptosyltransferase
LKKQPAFFTASLALGDCISATPFVRKLSVVYNDKVKVFSHFPELFRNLPYVSSSEDFKDHIDSISSISEKHDVYKSFFHMGKKIGMSDYRGIEFKHAQIDIRQYHAIDSGFMLKREELHCDFVSSEKKIMGLPPRYVVLHPFKNWDSRTWSQKSWTELVEGLVNNGIPVVLIGKDSLDEKLLKHLRENTNTTKEVFEEMENRQTASLQNRNVIDLTNKTSLSQAWHVLADATCVVTMDSGILHLAGTTDTHIVQLGSSIHPEFRAPYRKGSQEYKYHYILGSCDIFCASNLLYSLREWETGYNGATPLQSVPPLDKCLEKKKEFECHPSSSKVLEKVVTIWEMETRTEEERTGQANTEKEYSKCFREDNALFKIHSNALGDNIGAMAMIALYEKLTGKTVDVMCQFGKDIFGKSYPKLNLVPMRGEPVIDVKTGKWVWEGKSYETYKELRYIFDRPLMKGYADQLEIGYDKSFRPRIDLHKGERPIKGRYVCFSMHSTAQSKYWNYPNAWDTLCRMLRKEGITPVCIDRHPQFGIEGHWNPVPTACVKRHGLDLKEMTNYIHHAEFFIGISSGLSWVAHALGKPVVLISGSTSEDNEFSEDTLRIIEKSVCHGCINKTEHKFDAGDWMWCPVHKGSSQQFECTKSITPERVFEEIKKWKLTPSLPPAGDPAYKVLL